MIKINIDLALIIVIKVYLVLKTVWQLVSSGFLYVAPSSSCKAFTTTNMAPSCVFFNNL